MRHISLIGNENDILIRFIVTWKIPLPLLAPEGSEADVLMGKLPLCLDPVEMIYLIGTRMGRATWSRQPPTRRIGRQRIGRFRGNRNDLFVKEMKWVLTSQFILE